MSHRLEAPSAAQGPAYGDRPRDRLQARPLRWEGIMHPMFVQLRRSRRYAFPRDC